MAQFLVSTSRSKGGKTGSPFRFIRVATWACLTPLLSTNVTFSHAFLHTQGPHVQFNTHASHSQSNTLYQHHYTTATKVMSTPAIHHQNIGGTGGLVFRGNGKRSHRFGSLRLFATAPTGLPEASFRVQASHILVKEEVEADQIMQDLKDGKSTFAEIAMEKSQCPSKAKGGDLGAFGRGEMVPEFETACFENEAGALVKTKTQFGWHIIEVGQKIKMPLEIDPVMVKEWIDTNGSEKYQLIDVREKEEVDKAAVKEFQHLPLSEIQNWGPKIMAGEEFDKGKPTIVMCHHGMRSMQVATFLSGQAGFQDVYNVAGGIDAYARSVDSSITRY